MAWTIESDRLSSCAKFIVFRVPKCYIATPMAMYATLLANCLSDNFYIMEAACLPKLNVSI